MNREQQGTPSPPLLLADYMHSIGLKGLNTFMSFDAPSLAHAYSVVRHLYDGWAVHIRQKGVHGRSKLV